MGISISKSIAYMCLEGSGVPQQNGWYCSLYVVKTVGALLSWPAKPRVPTRPFYLLSPPSFKKGEVEEVGGPGLNNFQKSGLLVVNLRKVLKINLNFFSKFPMNLIVTPACRIKSNHHQETGTYTRGAWRATPGVTWYYITPHAGTGWK